MSNLLRAKVFESIPKVSSASGGVHVAICRPWPKKFTDPKDAWEWSLAGAGAKSGEIKKPEEIKGGGFNYRYSGSVMVFEAASEEKPKK